MLESVAAKSWGTIIRDSILIYKWGKIAFCLKKKIYTM